MNIISVKKLTKSYKENHVLRGVSFEIEKGTVYALLGSNGAGKTTIINILATLLSADSGTVSVAGHDTRTDAKNVRRHISLTGQYSAIDDLLSGEENMHMMGRLNRMDSRAIRTRTTELLDKLDLASAAKKRVSTYSGGMQRKLDLAISLLSSPSIIFLDEPTTGLDPRSRQELWRMIKELARGGTTILLTTQYLDEADNLADRIAVLNNGKIVAKGTASELKQRISGEHAELTFGTATDCTRASKSVTDSVIDENNPCLLSVPLTNHLTDLQMLLDTLVRIKIEPVNINIRKPTLDDVFMQLTGRSDEQETK